MHNPTQKKSPKRKPLALRCSADENRSKHAICSGLFQPLPNLRDGLAFVPRLNLGE